MEERPKSVSSKKSTHIVTDQYFSTHIDKISNELLERCVSNTDLKDESISSDYSTDDTDVDGLAENFFDPFSLKKRDIEKNYVLKICNQMRSFSFVDQEQVDEANVQNFKPDNQTPTPTEYPSEYFDKSSNDDFEYEYTEIIIDDFRKVLDRYDGTVSADNFIRKQLPSPEFFRQKSRSKSSEKLMDMYLILKRMLTKKKYVEATIKMEKESRKNKMKRNMNSNVSLKSRPSTALISASDLPETKEYKPRMVNLIPMKQMNQIENEDNYDTIDDELNERLDATNYYFYSDVAKSDFEYYYDPFKMDIPSHNQEWPYELEFEMERKKIMRSTKPKCNTCKKLPSIKTDEKSKQTKPLREKSNVSSESKYLGHTFNSASRCTSAKNQQTESKKNTGGKNKLILMNNYSDEFDIDKRSKEDEDYKDLKANIRVNKEEHMRKMNILPGKSFHSQRRKSITIEHVPYSQKKLETQKAKVLLTAQRVEVKSDEKNQEKRSEKHLDSTSSASMESSLPKKKPYLALEHQEMFYMIRPNDDCSKSQVCYPFTKMNTKKNKKESTNKKTANRPKTSKV